MKFISGKELAISTTFSYSRFPSFPMKAIFLSSVLNLLSSFQNSSFTQKGKKENFGEYFGNKILALPASVFLRKKTGL